jgi:class 3 adenylate cyclase
MAWDRARSLERINKLMASVPTVTAVDLSKDLYPTMLKEVQAGSRARIDLKESFQSIPRNRAILVDGVHVYARLANYDEYRLEGNHETEQGHKRGLNFLHLHYAASDRIIEDFGAIRIDYHGGRMHCVVAEPLDDEYARIAKAIELAQRLIEFSSIVSRDIASGNYQARMKIGIDTGKCVAIRSGSGHDQDPLFLGNAANYAAKLAEGEGEGIFLSNEARRILGMGTYISLNEERSNSINAETRLRTSTSARTRKPELGMVFDGGDATYTNLIKEWRADIQNFKGYAGGQSAFVFHQHTPPLKTIDFGNLSPGNSIRMPLVSIFGDVSGYTAYIENAMQTGRVGEAVRAIHVIRGELHNVLKDDFSSRKVRYIGDCIHGLLAVGQPNAIDTQTSVIEAVQCAAAMRSSFNLIKQMLALNTLGLAIGVETGITPVSRIGRRGDGSVRVASSSATIISETEQSDADGTQLAIGQAAYDALPLYMRNAFQDRKADGLDCDVYDLIFGGAPAVVTHTDEPARAHGSSAEEPYRQPARAHSVIG